MAISLLREVVFGITWMNLHVDRAVRGTGCGSRRARWMPPGRRLVFAQCLPGGFRAGRDCAILNPRPLGLDGEGRNR